MQLVALFPPSRGSVGVHARRVPSLGLAACLCLLALAVPRTSASPLDAFRGEFWTDLDYIPKEGEEWPLSDATAAARVLDEAAWVFSGMIGGFEFDWHPENKARQIAESFSLRPVEAIPQGDKRLRPGATRRDASRMSAWIDFAPDATDLLLIESNNAPEWKPAQGRASIARTQGFSSRREAYVQAVRAAIENWTRSVESSRPSRVTGRVALAAIPSVAIVAGAYTVTARVRVDTRELRRWEVW